MSVHPSIEPSIGALTTACPGDNPLAQHYRDFRVDSRALLTGHSHQAWPDCAKQGVLAAYQDAALHVDDKWDKAMQVAGRVQRGYAQRLGDPHGEYVLGQNVHELVLRLFSGLPAYTTPQALARRSPILSTQGEFHSLRRQLDRWREYGIEVDQVPHDLEVVPALIAKLQSHAPGHYGAITVSAVGFLNGLWIQDFGPLAKAAREAQTPLIIDAYHAINVVPFSVEGQDLHDAYVLGGGYKYCQLGEGVCFLRLPAQTKARPALTGWFAEFHVRDKIDSASNQVHYAPGAAAYAGSTYDPTSHYRAAQVFDFFDQQGLDLPTLRAISQRQVGRLQEHFLALGRSPDQIRLAHEVPNTQRAGFLALRTPHAAQLCTLMREREVWTDSRAEILRFGPAPYLSDAQLDQSIEALDASLLCLGRGD